jgi:hypothetical protein
MKKVVLYALAALSLSPCVGFVDGKSKTTGKVTHDMYILHPIITITGYTSQL